MNYTVRPGDTLSAIAHKSGITVDALLFGNPQIKDKNKIYAGQALVIPNPKNQMVSPIASDNEIVMACPVVLPIVSKKINLLDADNREIFDALKKNCQRISDITSVKPSPIRNTVQPSKQNALAKIEQCLSQYDLSESGEAEARKILTHWSRNELGEMPIYLGTLDSFSADFEAAGYAVEKYPASQSVFHENVTKNPTKWKVIDKSTGEVKGWEYVFNEEGKIVTAIEDAGTYNISSGGNHIVDDIWPYYKYGSGPRDSTTILQRSAIKSGEAIPLVTKEFVSKNVVQPFNKAAKATLEWRNSL